MDSSTYQKSMTAMPQRISPAKAAFWAAFTIAMVFALYTQHAWEDYWITFRTSKNLATGHGLVFNVGDRLHTFTSPLGVLLPALASLLTANSSDPAALWIFRLMGATALGGRCPINPSGGLFGGGHPVGASGVRMVLDAARQVTGAAGDYQVEGATRFATLNLGGSATTACAFVLGAA